MAVCGSLSIHIAFVAGVLLSRAEQKMDAAKVHLPAPLGFLCHGCGTPCVVL
jgi:hypothetical protein